SDAAPGVDDVAHTVARRGLAADHRPAVNGDDSENTATAVVGDADRVLLTEPGNRQIHLALVVDGPLREAIDQDLQLDVARPVWRDDVAARPAGLEFLSTGNVGPEREDQKGGGHSPCCPPHGMPSFEVRGREEEVGCCEQEVQTARLWWDGLRAWSKAAQART